MIKKLELTNYEIPAECCTLEINKRDLTFYRGNKKTPFFTGLYFRDNTNFLGIYPTKKGPMIYFKGNEYCIHPNLHISLKKNGKNREFRIHDYNIEINYTESPYIGFDVWSEEIDVDLLFMIEQNYKLHSFYEKFTVR